MAAIFSYEYGIAVRSGSFCAQPYVRRLLAQDRSGCEPGQPGLVRGSFGLYSTLQEVGRLAAALRSIAAGDYDGLYERDAAGGFRPLGWEAAAEELFRLAG